MRVVSKCRLALAKRLRQDKKIEITLATSVTVQDRQRAYEYSVPSLTPSCMTIVSLSEVLGGYSRIGMMLILEYAAAEQNFCKAPNRWLEAHV